jgi:hypothetical protein
MTTEHAAANEQGAAGFTLAAKQGQMSNPASSCHPEPKFGKSDERLSNCAAASLNEIRR